MKQRFKINILTVALVSLGLSFSILEASSPKKAAGSRSSEKITEIPKSVGLERSKAADTKPAERKRSNADLVRQKKIPERQAPSGYHLDGSKQDKAYDFVSMPIGGGFTTDNIGSNK